MVIYQESILALFTLMRQVVNNIAPTIIPEFFFFLNVNDDLRVSSHFHQSSANTIWNGLETVSNLRWKFGIR